MLQPKFNRIEAENLPSFEDALNASLTELGNQGLNGVEGEPKVVIVLMQSSALDADGVKLVNTIVYTGATNEDIANDLNSRPE